jgi:transposase
MVLNPRSSSNRRRIVESSEWSSNCLRDRTHAPILFHGLSQLSLPVVCVESRQAYQALKSLATHKTDRNDARAPDIRTPSG